MPLLCEALSSCRGRRAHHAQKDRVGTWDIPRPAIGKDLPWSASGRRGAVADDARTWEVGPRHSSVEAGEQGGANRCGVGGAKGGDQGECEPAQHGPGSEPGNRVTGAGAHTASSKAKEEGEVHRTPPPYQHRPPRRAFFELKKDAAPGVDELTWKAYEAELEHKLEDLHA